MTTDKLKQAQDIIREELAQALKAGEFGHSVELAKVHNKLGNIIQEVKDG